MNIIQTDNTTVIKEYDSFNIKEILECGQCFRFSCVGDNKYSITALNRHLTIEQKDDEIILYPCTITDFECFWYDYFDFGTDYNKIKAEITKNDPVMKRAVDFASGIRLLNQDPFETLISFIISQNNNIPRIKGIIGRLSDKYGTDTFFPALSQLEDVTVEDYMAIGTGFRAKYLFDCVNKLKNNEINLSTLYDLPTAAAREQLLKIKGVGNKVADCVLLFSLKKHEVFPVDVWVKRVMEQLYFNGKESSINEIAAFAQQKWGNYAGYAQQYLFYYARCEKIGVNS